MRCDWLSTPTRGSRLMGLLSMIITSVLELGRRAHAESKKASEIQRQRISDLSAKTQRPRVDTGFELLIIRVCATRAKAPRAQLLSLWLCASVVNRSEEHTSE